MFLIWVVYVILLLLQVKKKICVMFIVDLSNMLDFYYYGFIDVDFCFDDWFEQIDWWVN